MRVFPLVAAMLLTACQTASVRTDFDPAANFTTYRTYQWLPSEAPQDMDPLMFRRVKDSIDRSLTARGYTQADPGDFAVTFTIDERDQVHSNDDNGNGWAGYRGGEWIWRGYGYGWGRWSGGWVYPSVDIYTVTERSIVIDVYDARTRMPAWHGVVKRESYSDRVDYGRLDRAVDAVLAKFPPQQQAGNTNAS